MSRQKPRIPRPVTKAVTNGKPPTPIETAIDAAEQARQPMRLELLVSKHPLVLKPDGRLSIAQGDKPAEAQLLVRGPDGLWHGVLMPTGSTFELRPSAPAAALWTPPGAAKR